MPRTNDQAKRKPREPATTPSRSPARRRAAPPRSAPPAPALPENLPEHASLLPPPPETSYSLPAPPGADDPGTTPHLASSPPTLSPTLAMELAALWPDLQALAYWWHERQSRAQQDEPPDRQLVRQTYHIEQRYIDAVKREGDRTGESYAAVVNRAFARYFAGS